MTRERTRAVPGDPVSADLSGMSRRAALHRSAAAVLALGSGAIAAQTPATALGEEAGMILRNSRPLDMEAPVEALDVQFTPNDRFFVRSHLSVPAIGLAPWRLDVGGMLDSTRSLSLEDLAALEQATVPAVLQCSGNGRANFRPRLAGVQWERGAVGHAEWGGVPLAVLLAKFGLKKGAKHVQVLGGEAPPSPKTPVYLRSIPLERALHPDTLLATRMNGEPLPLLHGGPIRLIVPGWTGNHWIKWVRRITVAADEAPGFYMQTGYRLPKATLPPGAVPKPADLVPLTSMNVKSLITAPAHGVALKIGRNEVRGAAWTGDGYVTRVEFQTDRDASWVPAILEGNERVGSWRRWKVAWNVKEPGRYTLRVRATDSRGETQPETTPWNRSGYLWNGIDQVQCEVS